MEGRLEALPTSPLNEAHDHEYTVSACHFALEFKTETGFVHGVHQEARYAERCRWRLGWRGAAVDGAQYLAGTVNGVGFHQILPLRFHEFEKRICQLNLPPPAIICGKASQS
jgi:hypothetical protein